jgi:hypothetical protein
MLNQHEAGMLPLTILQSMCLLMILNIQIAHPQLAVPVQFSAHCSARCLVPMLHSKLNTHVRSKLKRQDQYLSQIDAQGRSLYLHAICLSSPSLHKSKFKIKRQYDKKKTFRHVSRCTTTTNNDRLLQLESCNMTDIV